MLDFLSNIFKSSTPIHTKHDSIKSVKESKQDQESAQTKQKQIEQNRQNFLKQVQETQGQESQLIPLILNCDFADGRLQAAEKITTKQGLETIKNALINIDKRVVKLMQLRLDEIEQHEQKEAKLKACIEHGRILLNQEILLANHVIELDQQYESIQSPSIQLNGQFQNIREQLTQQLTLQSNLQRQLLDIIQQPEWATEDVSSDTLAQYEQQLNTWKVEVEAILNHEKSVSLPKNLVVDTRHFLIVRMQKKETLSKKIQNTINKDKQTQPKEIISQTKDVTVVPISEQLNKDQIENILRQFELAIEQGSVKNSRQIEREIRKLSSNNSLLTQPQRERLTQAKHAFSQLHSLAKWSGDVSRVELISTAVGLANLSLEPKELVSTVTALRQQWKQMEHVSGGASKEMWAEFDNACNAAYAPAAQHFQELDEQRKVNLVKAEKLLLEMKSKSEVLLSAEIDWKLINQTIVQFQQEWKKQGLIEKKYQFSLNEQFNNVVSALQGPLKIRQEEECALREKLIEEAGKINATQRDAVEQIKALQEKWQKQAQQVPLKRQEEQTLWDQFRAACDAVFNQKKQANAQADADRHQNLQLKINICEKIESILSLSANEAKKLQKELASEWKNIGAVPRSSETEIENRYKKTIQVLNINIIDLEKKEKNLNSEYLLKKILICQKIEALMLQSESNEAITPKLQELKMEWDSVPSLGHKNSSHDIINQRRKKAQTAIVENQTAYRHILKENVVNFDSKILVIEILAGVESPKESSSERLKKQVEVLQFSMKNGQDNNHLPALIQEIIAMPVVLDEARQSRLKQVFYLV